MQRHAEIAGAGFSGLTAAIALLQRGWSVRVHERTPSLRSEGFGISIHDNGRRVLKALGVLDPLLEQSVHITHRVVRDGAGRIASEGPRPDRQLRLSRELIVSVMAERARALGGDLITGSVVTGADARGELILENGSRLRADLVIGADGYNSNVRDALGLMKQRRMLRDGAMRLVITRTESERAAAPEGCGTSYENWSGTRRVIYSPCGPTQVYVAMSCLHGDEDGMAVPVREMAWRSSFPYLNDVFDRVAAQSDWSRVKWVRFQTIKLQRWSQGRVAIVGDAAHAMPPNLGQGGGCAMVNALSLAVMASEEAHLERALTNWEARERPITEHTQRWSRIYGAVTFWPEHLRALAFKAVARSPWIRSQLHRAANYVPLGADA